MVIMAITSTPATVDCDTCGMHTSTEGNPGAPPGQAFGLAVDADGISTDLTDAAAFLTHYGDLICVREDCPHRTL